MTYLYHWVPNDMKGTILYPLNILKEKYPNTYVTEVQKYLGRETLMKQHIPFLNCLWNDVLHFSAVHPRLIKNALIEAGSNSEYTMIYFQVESSLLQPSNTIVYLYNHDDVRNKMKESNFISYDPQSLEQFSTLPQETKDYYKDEIKQGNRPLVYVRIPHILYKGSLDTGGLSIITV